MKSATIIQVSSRTFTVLFMLIFFFSANAQNYLGQRVHQVLGNKLLAEEAVEFELFKLKKDALFVPDTGGGFLSSSSVLELNSGVLTELYMTRPNLLQISIPKRSGEMMLMTMYRVDIYAPNAKIGGMDANRKTISGSDANIYYRGVLNTSEEEWGTLSLDGVSLKMMIASTQGNWNLSKMELSEDYLLFNDQEVNSGGFDCTVAGLDYAVSHVNELSVDSKKQSCPIVMFWLGDYDLYTAHNYNLNATTATLGDIFNNVATLYQQEGVGLVLGSNYAYFQPDGYSETNVPGAFLAFGQNIHNDQAFLGHDLATFIALDWSNNTSGYAVIDAFCSTNFYYNQNTGVDGVQGRFAYARIANGHSAYPNFSKTINVIAHELGHNLGSRHTHWCGWPGGAIDNCSSVEPDNFGSYCASYPPSNGGTIMSYCANVYGSIPFSNGFGFYPNQEILSDIAYNDACICSGLGLSDFNQTIHDYVIAPNPVSNVVAIVDSKSKVKVTFEAVEVRDLSGKILIEGKNLNAVNVENLEAGAYFIVFSKEGSLYTLSWVKQ